MMGARAMLKKTAEMADAAAQVYPRVMELLEDAGVQTGDRESVLELVLYALRCCGREKLN